MSPSCARSARSEARSGGRVPTGVGPQFAADRGVGDHEAAGVGDLLWSDQTAELLKDIEQAQRPLEERKERTLWDSPLLLILFTLVMGGERLLRKRSDLL